MTQNFNIDPVKLSPAIEHITPWVWVALAVGCFGSIWRQEGYPNLGTFIAELPRHPYLSLPGFLATVMACFRFCSNVWHALRR